MESLEHWDYANYFSGQEIAMLLIGCDPASATSVDLKKAYPTYKLTRDAYHAALSLADGNPFLDEEKLYLKSKLLKRHCRTKTEAGEDLLDLEEMLFEKQQFARQDVVDWIKSNSLKSKYAFELEQETPEKYRKKVQHVVEKHGGNKTKAAKELGITPQRVGQLLKAREGPKPLSFNAHDPFGKVAKSFKLKASQK